MLTVIFWAMAHAADASFAPPVGTPNTYTDEVGDGKLYLFQGEQSGARASNRLMHDRCGSRFSSWRSAVAGIPTSRTRVPSTPRSRRSPVAAKPGARTPTPGRSTQ